jgi:hypothetical protein
MHTGPERIRGLSHPIVNTYEEACHVVEHLGIVPLSSFIPGHPSLVSITQDAAWHTGTDTVPGSGETALPVRAPPHKAHQRFSYIKDSPSISER